MTREVRIEAPPTEVFAALVKLKLGLGQTPKRGERHQGPDLQRTITFTVVEPPSRLGWLLHDNNVDMGIQVDYTILSEAQASRVRLEMNMRSNSVVANLMGLIQKGRNEREALMELKSWVEG